MSRLICICTLFLSLSANAQEHAFTLFLNSSETIVLDYATIEGRDDSLEIEALGSNRFKLSSNTSLPKSEFTLLYGTDGLDFNITIPTLEDKEVKLEHNAFDNGNEPPEEDIPVAKNPRDTSVQQASTYREHHDSLDQAKYSEVIVANKKIEQEEADQMKAVSINTVETMSELAKKENELIDAIKNTNRGLDVINDEISYLQSLLDSLQDIDKRDSRSSLIEDKISEKVDTIRYLIDIVDTRVDQMRSNLNKIMVEIGSRDKWRVWYRAFSFIINAIAFILVALVFIGYQEKRKLREEKRKNFRLREEQAKKDKELLEKEIFTRELHHRMRNSLMNLITTFELQERVLKNANTSSISPDSFFKDVKSRIYAMASAHKALYIPSDFSDDINMKAYLEGLVKHFNTTYNTEPSKFVINLEVEECILPMKAATNIGMLVNEIVSNAFKHAFEGREEGIIEIKLLNVGSEEFQIILKDDGIGLESGFDYDRITDSLGSQLISSFIESIHGEYQLRAETGTCLEIIFKNPKIVDPLKNNTNAITQNFTSGR